MESGLGRNESEPFACARHLECETGAPVRSQVSFEEGRRNLFYRVHEGGGGGRDEIICPGKKWQG